MNTAIHITMTTDNMATHKRINITIHPIELKKLDEIVKENNETRSGMITRLIQNYQDKRTDNDKIADLTELSYELRDRNKKR